MLNTTGSVELGPQDSGTWKGLTIFEDPTLSVKPSTCDGRAGSPGDWDVALRNMGSSGANGALGSISGTIYAPNDYGLFGDSVSGKANLAIWAGCIYMDGGDSTFDFQDKELFGVGSALSE